MEKGGIIFFGSILVLGFLGILLSHKLYAECVEKHDGKINYPIVHAQYTSTKSGVITTYFKTSDGSKGEKTGYYTVGEYINVCGRYL